MAFRPPKTSLVRKLIESVGEGIYPEFDKRVKHEIDYEQLRMALKYQFLIAGRASEVAGQYRPVNKPYENALESRFGHIEAIIFPITKAFQRKGDQPKIRGVCIPRSPEYEPWTNEVYAYVTSKEDPFF